VSASGHGIAPWLAGALSAALLGLIGFLDYYTGKQASFTLLYLLPISTAKWFVGRRAGLIFCFAAAAIGLVAALSDSNPSLPAELWNAGIRLGVYLTFCTLLRQLRGQITAIPVLRQLGRSILLVVGSACALAAVGWILQRHLSPTQKNATAVTSLVQSDPQRALAELASLVDRSMRASRPV